MNTKSTLSALCLCLTAGSADAAIISYSSYYELSVFAGYNSTYILEQDLTDYSNNVAASDTGSVTTYNPECDCNVTTYSSAVVIAALDVNADLNAGIFTAAGSYDSSRTGWLSAGATPLAVQMDFDITTPYLYTLDITTSPGTAASVVFQGGNLWDDYINISYDTGGTAIHQSGVLFGGVTYLYVQIFGCIDACIGGPNGDFQMALTLTPTTVPVPAAAWLFGSGLAGLIGMARRKFV